MGYRTALRSVAASIWQVTHSACLARARTDRLLLLFLMRSVLSWYQYYSYSVRMVMAHFLSRFDARGCRAAAWMGCGRLLRQSGTAVAATGQCGLVHRRSPGISPAATALGSAALDGRTHRETRATSVRRPRAHALIGSITRPDDEVAPQSAPDMDQTKDGTGRDATRW